MSTGAPVETRLHLSVVIYDGITWSGNPHLVHAHDGPIPELGSTIAVGDGQYTVSRIVMAEDGGTGSVIDCFLDDDRSIAMPMTDPSILVLPDYDDAVLAGRIAALGADGWVRDFTPHVRADR